MQARLQKYLGTTGTNVYLETSWPAGAYDTTVHGSPLNRAYLDALSGIDKWILAIQADKSTATPTQKVVNDKPATLVSGCYAANQAGTLLTTVTKITDHGEVQQDLPSDD